MDLLGVVRSFFKHYTGIFPPMNEEVTEKSDES